MDIDIVILWVDGNDSEWQNLKHKYQMGTYNDSNSDNRYRDWGLLPYWFRSVEKFLPWFRTIHFVTCGHYPQWLNLHAEKLHFVKHEDFIPADYLPTFSSHAIELNIHRISGLAEHFIYFNDDMFALNYLPASKFFQKGLPCTCGSEIPIHLNGEIGIWQHASVNNLGIVNRNFSKKESFKKHPEKYVNSTYRLGQNIRTYLLSKIIPNYYTGFENIHGPGAYLKSTFEDIWELEYDKLHKTCLEKFRSNDDVNQWVFLWWQIARGRFMPSRVDNLLWEINDELIDKITTAIITQSHDFICLNDGELDVDVEELSKKIQNAFETILPEKSQFEL